MINLKTVSLGLIASSLGILALTTEAQAYSFNFLGSSPSGTGSTHWDFQLGVGPGETFSSSSTLAVAGFEDISGGSTFGVTTPNPNNDILPAPFFFKYASSSADKKTAYFSIPSGFLGGSAQTIYFQTFRVTAMAVPSGEVFPNFGGGPGGQLPPTPVPEPFTILGSLAALGFGAFGQKEYAKKQSQNSDSDLT